MVSEQPNTNMEVRMERVWKRTPRACWKCGGEKIEVVHCSHPSLNHGQVRCLNPLCGNTVSIELCKEFPHDQLVREWNRSRREALSTRRHVASSTLLTGEHV